MRSDVGGRREINEDSAVSVPPVFAVADGMGGHDAGEIASRVVVERLARVAADTDMSGIHQALRDAVHDLSETEAEAGSGTTVTGALLSEDQLIVFNIGDSRVYLLRENQLVQLTRDHSVVQDLVDAGHISEREAETHPHANVITRAVGFHDDPEPDTVELAPTAGDRLLLCSDGLTKELTAHGIAHFLAESDTVDAAAESLMEAALGNGGRDNVTVIVLDVVAAS